MSTDCSHAAAEWTRYLGVLRSVFIFAPTKATRGDDRRGLSLPVGPEWPRSENSTKVLNDDGDGDEECVCQFGMMMSQKNKKVPFVLFVVYSS